MATDGYVNRWDGVAYVAAEERRLASVALMPGATAFSARPGRRVGGGGLAVSVGGTPEAATVTPGAGVIFDPNHAAQGVWPFEVPTSKSINLAARPGAGQSRIDLVVARIYDSGISVGAVKEVKIEVVPGAAGSTPAPPATPALSLALATLTVPSSGTVSVGSSTAYSVAAGGVLPVATTAERDAVVGSYRGLVVDNAQTGALERYNGTAWKTLAEVEAPVWADLTPNATWTKSANFGAARDRGRVFLSGYLNRLNTGTFGDYASVVQLPAGMYTPGVEAHPILPPPRTGGVTTGMKVTATGVLQIYMSAYSGALVSVEGTNWRL